MRIRSQWRARVTMSVFVQPRATAATEDIYAKVNETLGKKKLVLTELSAAYSSKLEALKNAILNADAILQQQHDDAEAAVRKYTEELTGLKDVNPNINAIEDPTTELEKEVGRLKLEWNNAINALSSRVQTGGGAGAGTNNQEGGGSSNENNNIVTERVREINQRTRPTTPPSAPVEDEASSTRG